MHHRDCVSTHLCCFSTHVCVSQCPDRGTLLDAGWTVDRHVTRSSLSAAFWCRSRPLTFFTSDRHNSNWTLCWDMKSYKSVTKGNETPHFWSITWFVVVLHSPNVFTFSTASHWTFMSAGTLFWWMVGSLGLHEVDKRAQTSGSVFCCGVNPPRALGRPPYPLEENRVAHSSHIRRHK